MSRIAKYPINLPAGVTLNLNGHHLQIKGAKGSLEYMVSPQVQMSQEGQTVRFKPVDGSLSANALAGCMRATVSNLVEGVTKGFETKLELVGVGYRAQAQGKQLNLTLGFSHPVVYNFPEGINIETPSQTEILIKGIDKQLVGQVAADIRAFRPPEPYKGKGVRYANEKIILKETKKK